MAWQPSARPAIPEWPPPEPGDVLTGMVGGLLAQGLAPWDAACAATYFHGLAGDLAAQHLGQAGMIASDLIQHIPHALAPTT
jgi:NAD(P)H-hydrate repair Nnr-like enzyme with NAD(P)H-hydrate dehydratase domain